MEHVLQAKPRPGIRGGEVDLLHDFFLRNPHSRSLPPPLTMATPSAARPTAYEPSAPVQTFIPTAVAVQDHVGHNVAAEGPADESGRRFQEMFEGASRELAWEPPVWHVFPPPLCLGRARGRVRSIVPRLRDAALTRTHDTQTQYPPVAAFVAPARPQPNKCLHITQVRIKARKTPVLQGVVLVLTFARPSV